MIKDDSYIVIPGWVINKYNLKGNSLLIYSIIYGFCQDRESCFHGSLNYLAEWTQSTRQSIIGVLKDLVNMGLIRKEEGYPNNKYYIIFDEPEQSKDSLHDSKDSLHNNIDNNKEYIIDNTKDNNNNTNPPKGVLVNNKYTDRYTLNKYITETISNVVTYMNKVCGTSYKPGSSITQRCIRARLNEGFTEADLKKVIDIKYRDWGLNPKKFSNGQMSNTYLRPQTLFGTNMESYLQQESAINKNQVRSVPVDETKLSDMVF